MRRLNWKVVASVVGAAFVVWFVTGFILAGREASPPPPGTQPVTLHGGRVTGNRISTRSWTFDYQRAQMSPDGTLATVDGVRHGVLYKKGKPYLSIAAEHVSVNTQTFDFTATGQVHVEALNSKDHVRRSFDTDLVQWTNATKILSLSHQSLLRTGGEVLRVASITVNFNTNDIHVGKIEGAVQAPGP
jgi:hypothetical protein